MSCVCQCVCIRIHDYVAIRFIITLVCIHISKIMFCSFSIAASYVTKHEKTGLMYTKYSYSFYGTYLLYFLRYKCFVICIRFLIKFYINYRNFIRLVILSAKLWKFEIQTCGQILCAYKPYFLMLGHICSKYLAASYEHHNVIIVFLQSILWL